MSVCHVHQGIGQDGEPILLPQVPANVLGKVSKYEFGSQHLFLLRPRFWNTANITRRNWSELPERTMMVLTIQPISANGTRSSLLLTKKWFLKSFWQLTTSTSSLCCAYISAQCLVLHTIHAQTWIFLAMLAARPLPTWWGIKTPRKSVSSSTSLMITLRKRRCVFCTLNHNVYPWLVLVSGANPEREWVGWGWVHYSALSNATEY